MPQVLQAFLVAFGVVFLAELPDKTMFATIVLSPSWQSRSAKRCDTFREHRPNWLSLRSSSSAECCSFGEAAMTKTFRQPRCTARGA
jgi:hypothetical protein